MSSLLSGTVHDVGQVLGPPAAPLLRLRLVQFPQREGADRALGAAEVGGQVHIFIKPAQGTQASDFDGCLGGFWFKFGGNWDEFWMKG